MADKLKAPVGASPRSSKGESVRNSPEDVILLRQMLRANGYNVPEGDKMDAGLLKAISAVQTKAGFKTPDQVVDPGGKTFDALSPKHEAAKKALAAEIAKVVLVKVRYQGKELMLTPDDYEKMKKEVFSSLERYIKSLLKCHKNNLATYEHYLNVAQIKEGFMEAVAQALIMSVGRVKYPATNVTVASIKAAGSLQNAVSTKNLAMLDMALPEAEQAVNAFTEEVRRFLKDFAGSAYVTGTVLKVTSAACFAVVGALAGPVMVAGGMTVAKAAVVSGAGVNVLSSATNELGKAASGQSVSPWESLWNVTVDGALGGLTGGISSKIPLGFVEKMAGKVAPAVASKIPGLTVKQVTPVIKNFLTGSGQETIKSAVNEGFVLMGKIAKTGKSPTAKDFDEATQKILVSLLTAGLVKNFATFQKKWAYDARLGLEGKMFPEALTKLLKGKSNTLPPVIRAKVWAEVWNKVSEQVLQGGLDAALSSNSGDYDPVKMTTDATKAVQNDARIRKLVEVEMEKALKKHKVSL